MASGNPSSPSERNSLLISQLPTNILRADLKDLLLGHFANFGRILRLSCSSKGGGQRVAHIQFASSVEAINAQRNGTIVNGHRTVIELTEKNPTTQIITPQPQPLPLRSTLGQTQNKASNVGSENKAKVQATLASYFQQKSGPKKENKDPCTSSGGGGVPRAPILTSVLNEATAASATSAERKPSKLDGPASTFETSRSVDRKPSSCVKLEVYNGPSTSRNCQAQSQPQPGPCTSSSLPASQTITQAATLRPTKSLREILNLDTTHMKIVKAATGSDALACQYFSGGRHPFPLSLMFGRIPGNVIMPTRTIMDSIKPGLEIKEGTLNTIWNTLLGSVIKETLQKSVKAEVREALVTKFAEEKYQEIEEETINKEIVPFVEDEVGFREDIMLFSEDVMEAMLGLVCSSIIEEVSLAEHRRSLTISKVVTCCYRKLTKIVVAEMVEQQVYPSFVDCLCEEVVDELLNSTVFDLHVKVIAGNAKKEFMGERYDFNNEPRSIASCSTFKDVDVLPLPLPPINRAELTSHWLETSIDDIQVDYYEPDESVTTIDTDISCSDGESEPAVSSEEKSVSAEVPIPAPSEPIPVPSEPIPSMSSSNSVTSNNPVATISNSESKSGFFGSLNSLKRKASAYCRSISFFKRPRLRQEDEGNAVEY